MTKLKNWQKLTISFLAVFVTASLGSLITAASVTNWYSSLTKPSFSPPNFLFGPVWTLLYFLMAIAVYLVWAQANKQTLIYVKIFFVHLIINCAWSFAFFGVKSPILGFGVIVVLWLFIVYLVINFRKVNWFASLLLVPYLLWVSFASVLNFFVMLLNF